MRKYNKYSKYIFDRHPNPEDDDASSTGETPQMEEIETPQMEEIETPQIGEIETLEEALKRLELSRRRKEVEDIAKRRAGELTLLGGQRALENRLSSSATTEEAIAVVPAGAFPTRAIDMGRRDPIFYQIIGGLKNQSDKSVAFVREKAKDLLTMAESPMAEKLLNSAISGYEIAVSERTVEPGEEYISAFAEDAKKINRDQKRKLEVSAAREKRDELNSLDPLVSRLKDLQRDLREVREQKTAGKSALKTAKASQAERILRDSIQRSGKFQRVNILAGEIDELRSEIKNVYKQLSQEIKEIDDRRASEAAAQAALFDIIDDILFGGQYPELSAFLEENADTIEKVKNLRKDIYSGRGTKEIVKKFNNLKDSLINSLSDYGNLPEAVYDYIGDDGTLAESIAATKELIKALDAQRTALIEEKLSSINPLDKKLINLLDKKLEGKKAELEAIFNSIIYSQPLSELKETLSFASEAGAVYYNLYTDIENFRDSRRREAEVEKTTAAKLSNLVNREEILMERVAEVEAEIKKLKLGQIEEREEILSERQRDLYTAALEYAVKYVNAKADAGVYAKKAETDYEKLIKEVLKDKEGKDIDISDDALVKYKLEESGLGFSGNDINTILRERNNTKRYNLITEIYKNVTQYSSLSYAPKSQAGKERIPSDFYDIIALKPVESIDDIKEILPITYVYGEKAALLRKGDLSYIGLISEDEEKEADNKPAYDEDARTRLATELTQRSLPESVRLKSGGEGIVLASEVDKGSEAPSDLTESGKQAGYSSYRLRYMQQIGYIIEKIPKLFDNSKELLEIDLERFKAESYDLSERRRLSVESLEIVSNINEILDIYLPYLAANELKFICETLRKSMTPGNAVGQDIARLVNRAAAGFYPAAIISSSDKAAYLELFRTIDREDYSDDTKLEKLADFCKDIKFTPPLESGIDNLYSYLLALPSGSRKTANIADQKITKDLEQKTKDAYVLIVKLCGLTKDKLKEYAEVCKSSFGNDPIAPAIQNIESLYEQSSARVKDKISRLKVTISVTSPFYIPVENNLSDYRKLIEIPSEDRDSSEFIDVRLLPLEALPSDSDPQKYLVKAIPTLFEDAKELISIVTYDLVTPGLWRVLRYGSGETELNRNLYVGIKVKDIEEYINNLYRSASQQYVSEAATKYEGVGGFLIARPENEPAIDEKGEELDDALRILMDRVILSSNKKIVPGTNIYNFAVGLIVRHVIEDLYKNTYALVTGEGGKNIKGAAKYKMISDLQSPDTVWVICYSQAIEALSGREDWSIDGEHPLKVRPHALYRKDKDGNYVPTGKEGGFEYGSSDPKQPAKASIIGYINKYILKELDRIVSENIYALTGGVASGKQVLTVRKKAPSFVMAPEVAPRDIKQKTLKGRRFDHEFRSYFNADRGVTEYVPYSSECYDILKRYVIFESDKENDLHPKLFSKQDSEGNKRDILDRYTYRGATDAEKARNKENLKKAISKYETAQIVDPQQQRLTQATDGGERETEIMSGREEVDYEAQKQYEQSMSALAREQGTVIDEPETGEEVNKELLRKLEVAKRNVSESGRYYKNPRDGEMARFIFEKYYTPSELDSEEYLTIEDIVEACINEKRVDVAGKDIEAKKRSVEKEKDEFTRNLKAEIRELFKDEVDLVDGKLIKKKAGEVITPPASAGPTRVFYKIGRPYAEHILDSLYTPSSDLRSRGGVRFFDESTRKKPQILTVPFFEESPKKAAQILKDNDTLETINNSITDYYMELLEDIESATQKLEVVSATSAKKLGAEEARKAMREGQDLSESNIPEDIDEDYVYRLKTGDIKQAGLSREYYGGLATYNGTYIFYNVKDIKDRLKAAISNMMEEKRLITSQIKDISNRLNESAKEGDNKGIIRVLGTELESASGKNTKVATIADMLYAINSGDINLGEVFYKRRIPPQVARSRRPYLEAAENLAAYLKKLERLR